MSGNHRIFLCSPVGEYVVQVTVADTRIQDFNLYVMVTYGMAGKLVRLEMPFLLIDGKALGRDTSVIVLCKCSHGCKNQCCC